MDTTQTFLGRNEFLIRRLHSLSGLIPVGAYMVIHLLTNASILDSASTFQKNVFAIHALGSLLVVVEWLFIFLPLIFHAVIGVVIIRGGLPNSSSYSNSSNIRYTLQRTTGMIAFVFIFWHVFHMHGWFHFDDWLSMAKQLDGANFRPYNAASSLGLAMQGFLVPLLYAIGVLACVFHLANGIWTMGITWGVWVSETAQRRASWVCLGFGVLLAFVGMGALVGATTVDVKESLRAELHMLSVKLISREVSLEQASHKILSLTELTDELKDEELAKLIEDIKEDLPAEHRAMLEQLWPLAEHGSEKQQGSKEDGIAQSLSDARGDSSSKTKVNP